MCQVKNTVNTNQSFFTTAIFLVSEEFPHSESWMPKMKPKEARAQGEHLKTRPQSEGEFSFPYLVDGSDNPETH